MEFTLDINMDDKAFATFKDEVFKAARENDACEESIAYHLSSTTPQEWLDNCGCYLGWLTRRDINIILKGFIYCEENLDLYRYKSPLPKTFTYCGGDLNLRGYEFPLPEGFTHCGGYLDLYGYKYALPEGFKAKGKY